MGKKSKQREEAQKRARKKKITALAVCAVFAVAVTAVAIIAHVNRPDTRVFAIGGQAVTLYDNGRFMARLAHNVNISGTFTEEVDGNVTAISFTHGGNTVSTQIEDDVLLLPPQWRATCRVHVHEIEFPLQ